jgi:threonine dehydrogenase-like Zn-dependent dehydrogenase
MMAQRYEEGMTVGSSPLHMRFICSYAMMQSFVMESIDKVGFMDKPLPKPGPNDAIVKTTHALICTSDTHTVHGALGERHGLVLGHEAVGIVSEVGSEVKFFHPGDRIVGAGMLANVKDGVLAEYFHVNDADANMALIPLNVPSEKAVYCADMLSTGLAAAENADIPMGGIVAVFSEGVVGLMAIAGARLCGAGSIICVDSTTQRLALARHYGADVIVDLMKEDPVKRVLEITEGVGVDSAIETVGSDIILSNTATVTRHGGTISRVGHHAHTDHMHDLRLTCGVGIAEKTIKTAFCSNGKLRMERMLRLIENGRIDPAPMTTHIFSFDRIDTAFKMMDDKSDHILKPLIVFA